MPMFDNRSGSGRNGKHHSSADDLSIREWLDGDGYFRFGKHEGEDLDTVAEDDPSYLEWVVEEAESIGEEEREVVRGALEYAEGRRGHRRRR